MGGALSAHHLSARSARVLSVHTSFCVTPPDTPIAGAPPLSGEEHRRGVQWPIPVEGNQL